MSENDNQIKMISDTGSGRTFIAIIDDEGYLPFARAVVDKLSARARCVLLISPSVTALTWESLSASLSGVLSNLNIRVASVVGMGAAATLAQNLALNEPKVVRTLAMMDSPSRPHPTWWERVVDRIEEVLPFGLPLRLGARGFNVKSYIHRLRCPVLLIASGKAGQFVRGDLRTSAAKAPTAWSVQLDGSQDQQIEALSSALLEFQDIAAKCPQKNSKQ
jgi:pimeloyl-ACP methyl ester carboxylesterase